MTQVPCRLTKASEIDIREDIPKRRSKCGLQPPEPVSHLLKIPDLFLTNFEMVWPYKNLSHVFSCLPNFSSPDQSIGIKEGSEGPLTRLWYP